MTDNKPAIKLHKTSIQLKQITKKYYFPNVTQKHKTQVYTFRKKSTKRWQIHSAKIVKNALGPDFYWTRCNTFCEWKGSAWYEKPQICVVCNASPHWTMFKFEGHFLLKLQQSINFSPSIGRTFNWNKHKLRAQSTQNH